MLHEDTRTGGFGAEIAATIAEEAFEYLDAPVKRITAPDTPVPFSPTLEKAFIPQVEDVVEGLQRARGSTRWRGRTDAVDVVMPQMGVSVSEGTVTKWLKQVGEQISADETLLEISTDKVDTEVPSPGGGHVAEILVPEGETVEVGTKLAVIAPEGAEVAAPAAPRRRRPSPRPRRRRPSRRRRRDSRRDDADRRGGRAEADAGPAAAPRRRVSPRDGDATRQRRRASSRPSSRASPPSTASTPARSRAPAAAAASRRRTSSPSSRAARQAQAAPQAPSPPARLSSGGTAAPAAPAAPPAPPHRLAAAPAPAPRPRSEAASRSSR